MDKELKYIKQITLAGVALGVIGTILYFTVQIIMPFLSIIVTAGIFTIFLNPLFKKLKSVTKKPNLSAAITVFALVLFIVIPLGLLLSSLVSEAVSVSKLTQANPEWISSFQTKIDEQIKSLPLPIPALDIQLEDKVYQVVTFIARNLGTVALYSGTMLLNLFFTLITVYFLLVNQSGIFKYIKNLNLFPMQYLNLITTRITEIVNGTVRGYLLVVILQLVVGITGFLIFNVPAAILLGSMYGISSLLPVVGGLLLWVPVVLWQLILGNVTSAVLLTLWFLLLSLLVENIIAPKIIGESTKLHQLLVMFAVFGGIQYFGILGMVLGPVVIALAFVATTILSEIVSQDTTKYPQ